MDVRIPNSLRPGRQDLGRDWSVEREMRKSAIAEEERCKQPDCEDETEEVRQPTQYRSTVEQLEGLNRKDLSFWRKTGVYLPSVKREHGDRRT
jgi:hypothetical protein